MRRLVPDFILRHAEAGELSGKMRAIAVSIDLIGFTAITHDFMVHSHAGAEALTDTIGVIFSPAIAALESRGGFIAGFAGDAFTALFEEDCPVQALAAAWQIRCLSLGLGRLETEYGQYELPVRIGIGHGEVEWEIIPHSAQTVYWFGGPGIGKAVEAQALARPNDLVCGELPCLPEGPRPWGCEWLDRSHCRITSFDLDVPSSPDYPALPGHDSLLPLALSHMLVEGEFRDILSCFVNLRSSDADQRHRITGAALAHGGYISHIDCTDKGWVMYVIFGAPRRYEQTRRRAMSYALDLAGEFGSGIRIGLSQGKAYAGFIGSSTRGEFTGMGRAVNLAARFMMKAPWGELWFDAALHKDLGEEFASESLGRVSYKGYPQPIETFRLLARRREVQFSGYGHSFVGRSEELEGLVSSCRELQKGGFAGLTYLYGAAGQGKSRLLHELKQRLGNLVRVVNLQADAIYPRALGPFSDWINREFGIEPEDSVQSRTDRFRRNWAAFSTGFSSLPQGTELIEELARIESLIGGLIGLEWEGSVYSQIAPQSRPSLIRQAIRSLIEIMARPKPVLMILEDLHWLDPESADLITLITRKASATALRLIVTSRFQDDGTRPKLRLDRDVRADSISLEGLKAPLVHNLMMDLLSHPVSHDLLGYVQSRSQGNPFIVVQLALYLEETGSLAIRDGQLCLSILPERMPDSVEGILIARIDRLEAQLKRMVQTASVLGYEFSRAILAVMLDDPEPPQPAVFQAGLERGELERIWNAVSEISYIFSHSLLRDAAYGMQLVKQLRRLHLQAAKATADMFGDDGSICGTIAYHYDKAGETAQAAVWYLKAGDYERDRFHFQAALDYYLASRGLVASLWGEEHPSYAKCLSRIGNVYFGKSEYDLALPWYQQALTIQRQALGSAHPEIADTLYNLANYNYVKGNHEQALDYYRQTIDMREELLGKDHPDTASSLNNLGNVLRDTGRYDQALEYYERALAIRRGLWEENHVRVAASYNDIANLHWNRGDYKLATHYYQKALQIREQVLGPRHPETADSLNCMGDIYSKMGDFEQALDHYRKALSIRVEVQGSRHSTTADCLNNIGIVYDITGEYVLALQHLEQALTIKQQVFGDLHVEVATVLSNIGSVYDHQGSYDLALQTHQKALSILEEVLGRDHAETASCLNNIGCAYENKGDNPTALGYYQQAYAIFNSVLGPKSPETSTALVNIGCVHENLGDYPAAIGFYQQALEIRRGVFGASHPATQRIQANIVRLEETVNRGKS